jgi:cytoskeletal protein RodZ
MPENTPPKTISWRKVILTVLVIVLVSGLISGVFFWYFVVRQPAESTPVTTNVATSSSKKATSSAPKDVTADWKTLTAKTRESNSDVYETTLTIRFSFKYPSAFKVINDEGVSVVTNDSNYQLGLKTEGAVAAFTNPFGEKPISYTETTLGGKKALRSVKSTTGSLTSVTYYISLLKTEEGRDTPFEFVCNFIPKTGLDNETVCDLIASTFKFL